MSNTAQFTIPAIAAPSSDAPISSIPLSIEFGGGLELLFSNKRTHSIMLPTASDAQPPTVKRLITYLADNVLSERRELFVEGETVRPGILVLVNDVDWELEGELEAPLKAGDEVVFISTLHGG